MKRITITYHMSKPGETAENCITVPVSDWAAQALDEWDKGLETQDAIITHMDAQRLCHTLAILAGYDEGFYVGSELAATQYAEAE